MENTEAAVAMRKTSGEGGTLKKKFGGPQVGAGRPRGGHNRRATIQQKAEQHADQALAVLVHTMGDPHSEMSLRVAAATTIVRLSQGDPTGAWLLKRMDAVMGLEVSAAVTENTK